MDSANGQVPHSALQELRTLLKSIHDAILHYQPLIAKPPILDSSLDAGTDGNEDLQWLQPEHIPGLKSLRAFVKMDLDTIEKFLDDPVSANLPPLSTNAPYLIAVWNEVLCAPAPVDAIFKSMPLAGPSGEQRQKGALRTPGTKVDVITDSGRCWIRVNTIKNSRLLAEFREIDSYLTESDDSSYGGSEDARPSLAQRELDNSVLRMGRSLLTAAKANPIEGTNVIPKVTFRLTRLDPSPTQENGERDDPRTAQTIRLLQEMGINVELGERKEIEIPAPVPTVFPSTPPKPVEPTLNINLDLSVLIALISDLTHVRLPKTIDEANKRFIPPPQYHEWKQRKNNMIGKKKGDPKNALSPASEGLEIGVDGIRNDFAKQSRALTTQLLQEMGKGLIQEMHERIPMPYHNSQPCQTTVKFWTTPEARDRCLRIISKIGGEDEKRRAHALFSSTSTLLPQVPTPGEAEELYWQDSRYPSKFIALLPINIFPPSSIPDVTLIPHMCVGSPTPTFCRILAKTCKDILAQETIPHPRALSDELTTDSQVPYDAAEIQRAIVTKANPRLTAHTVQTLLWGAELGWTTLTANRASVKAILREIKLARLQGHLDGISVGDDLTGGGGGDRTAAIWVVDPRSLAEGMSSLTKS